METRVSNNQYATCRKQRATCKAHGPYDLQDPANREHDGPCVLHVRRSVAVISCLGHDATITRENYDTSSVTFSIATAAEEAFVYFT